MKKEEVNPRISGYNAIMYVLGVILVAVFFFFAGKLNKKKSTFDEAEIQRKKEMKSILVDEDEALEEDSL